MRLLDIPLHFFNVPQHSPQFISITLLLYPLHFHPQLPNLLLNNSQLFITTTINLHYFPQLHQLRLLVTN